MDYPPTCQPTTCLSVFKLITKKTCLFAEKYRKSNGMLPPTPNIKPNHQSRWIWPSQHTTTQLQYALSWFASCYLSPNVSSWNTDKKHKKKKHPKKPSSLATWTLPPSPSFWKRSALQAIGASPGMPDFVVHVWDPSATQMSVGRHQQIAS